MKPIRSQNHFNFITSLLLGGALLLAGTMANACDWRVEPLGNGFAAGLPYQVLIAGTSEDPMLVAGGSYLAFDNEIMGYIARWNGTNWEPFGRGLSGPIETLYRARTDPTQFIVGGYFRSVIGGPRAEAAAHWNGAQWQGMGPGLINCTVSAGYDSCVYITPYTFAELDIDGEGPEAPQFYAGGYFSQGVSDASRGFARFTGNNWEMLRGDDSLFLNSLAVFGEGQEVAIYAAGSFQTNGALKRWTGSGWVNVGTPVVTSADHVVVHDDGSGKTLYVSGAVSANRRVLRLNGSVWQQIGGLFNGPIHALISSTSEFPSAEPLLIAAGEFTQIGGESISYLAQWDGRDWIPVANVDGIVHDVSIGASGNKPLLFLTGNFTSINGMTVNRIALLRGCPIADLNNDGHVNAADLGVLLGSWGNPGCAGGIPCPADLNNDGHVNAADLGILLGNWG